MFTYASKANLQLQMKHATANLKNVSIDNSEDRHQDEV